MKYLALTMTTAFVAVVLAAAPGGVARADHTRSHTKKQQHAAMEKKTVYVCAVCKAYCTPSQAKAMHYKDAMGHKLTRRRSMPAGYVHASKMAEMHGGASEHKAEHAKTAQPDSMKCPVCKTMDMTSAKTASNTQEVKIKGQTWYCCSGCDMSAIADK